MQSENLSERLRGLLALMDGGGKARFSLLLDQMREAGMSPRSQEFLFVLDAWTDASPVEAMEWAGESVTSLRHIFQRWMGADPTAAMEWARSHGESAPWKVLYLMALGGIASVDLPRATAELQKLDKFSERSMAIHAILQTVERQGRDDLCRWLDSLPSRQLRVEAVTNLIAGKGPGSAGDRVYWLEIYPEAVIRGNLVSSWAFWYQQDENAALSHFASDIPKEMKSQALEGMVSLCARTGDPAKGLELMDANSEAVTLRTAVVWVKETGKRDPSLALENSSRIQSDPERELAMSAVLRQWLVSNREEAIAWLDHHDLPEKVRESIR